MGLFYAGGHGPMFDLPECTAIKEIAENIYEENKGILGAVCHGTVGRSTEFFNSSPHNPDLGRSSLVSLLKTLWEKEKMR